MSTLTLAETESGLPFGLTTALPAEPSIARTAAEQGVIDSLTLCPDRQISVAPDGQPFVDHPLMPSATTTKSQTTEDSQPDEATETDTPVRPRAV